MTTEQRLERLERQSRCLTRTVIGIAVAGLSLVVMGQTLPDKVHDVVKAKTFLVVGDDGKRLVVISSAPTTPKSGLIAVGNGKKPLVIIGSNGGGAGFINTNNRYGKEMVEISTNTEEIGIVNIFNRKGKVLVSIGVDMHNNGNLATYDPAGNKLITITTDKNGEGAVVQYNRVGNPKAAWPHFK